MGNGGYDVLHDEIEIDVNPVDDTIQALTTFATQATEELPDRTPPRERRWVARRSQCVTPTNPRHVVQNYD